MSDKLLKIYHNDSNIHTINELFTKEKIIGLSPDAFLDVKSDKGKKNREIIYELHIEVLSNIYNIQSADQLSGTTFLPTPVQLFLPYQYATVDLLTSENNFQASDDYKAFLDDKIKNIINSPSYKNKQLSLSAPGITVWLWSKASGSLSDSKQITLFNLTPFVNNVTTNVTETGGNFSFDLLPLQIVDNSNVLQFFKYKLNEDYNVFFKSFFNKEDQEGNIIRTNLFFQNLICSNDLIFIKFEASPYSDDLITISPSQLPGNNFDMIGLVDNNHTIINSLSNDKNIQITGRDLMKLILDDGSFFFQNAESNSESRFGVFRNIELNDKGDDANAVRNVKASNRMILDGMIKSLLNPNARTISFVLNLLISRLSNIEICPGNLFDSYEDKTTFQFEGDISDISKPTAKTKKIASENE